MKNIVQWGIGVALVAVLIWHSWYQGGHGSPGLIGYIDGQSLYLASPIAATVDRLAVEKGQRVEAGAPLFTMDARIAAAQRRQAEAQVAEARRQTAAAIAKLAQMRANATAVKVQSTNAAKDFERYRTAAGLDRDSVTQQQIDNAETAAANAVSQSRVADEDIAAAAAQLEVNRAQEEQYAAALAEIESRLDLLSSKSPAAGRINEVFFRQGEWASADQPILALLPDDRVRVRFFVPETAVAQYRPGTTVQFACDGCAAGLTARIDFVSAQPEFTPPIIYSRSSRDRMVFMVEAIPADPRSLTPGQPVDVTPLHASVASS
jgi:HlyD family secretion protein